MIAKMMYCYQDLAINDIETIDNLIETLHVKLANGQAYSELSNRDFVTISDCLSDHPNSPLVAQVVQLLGDYVVSNLPRFTLEEQITIMKSLSSAKYRSRVSATMKLTPADVRNAIMSGLGIHDSKEINFGFSATDNCYSLTFANTNTRL